jgi:hypothetical protein
MLFAAFQCLLILQEEARILQEEARRSGSRRRPETRPSGL